jgi:predicted  nucleic acid-binding Zn-ribbon protein
MTRANAKLESVQNSQEFQAANKEMDQLRKLNQSLDEQLKKTAGDIESENKALATLIGEFEKTGSEQAAQLGVMAGQSADLDGGIAKLMEERKNFTVGVEPRILSLYDRVRAARGGIGIVPSVGGRCSGCNMMVPPQVYNEIQCGTVVHNCPSCHRLLFIPEIVGQ